MKIVKVKWVDASNFPEWSAQAWEDGGLVEVETVGYLIGETDERVDIGQNNVGNYKFGGIMSIPKCSIKKIKVLRK